MRLPAFVCLLLAACAPHRDEPAAIDPQPGSGPARYVNVFIGTDDAGPVENPVTNGAGGSTFPAAAAPFGLVQWGPDTPSAVPPGYRHADDQIVAFSLNHLSGAGCPAQRDLPMTPAVGELGAALNTARPFKHENERASPGFYEVRLDDGITVDLTATQRAGLSRFTFPPAADARLILRNGVEIDVVVARDAELEIVSPTLIVGSRLDAFCVSGIPTRIYFAARFERPFSAEAFGAGDARSTRVTELQGGFALTFDTREDPIVQVKVGMSSVSTQQALENLDHEVPDWDFNATRKRTLARWDDYLSRVAVSGGTEVQKQALYSALYRVFLQPAVWSDVSGSYFGFDQKTHPADGRVHYANFSGWDIYRSWIQLVALLAPIETSDMIRSLILDGQQGGALPKWAYGASETGVMIGDPADVMIANAWAFGARDFDSAAALTLMKHGATQPSAACNGLRVRPGLADYLSRHYCPVDSREQLGGATAMTMEYAIADFAIGRFAAMLGDTMAAAEFTQRGQYWKNVFDPSATAGVFSGYVQPRRFSDVTGAPDFVPKSPDSTSSVVEGSLAQYSFLAPQDVPGLIAAMGGDAAFITRLDHHLIEVNAGTHGPHFYIGNEPGFATPWLYPFAGAPWKTQEAVHRILERAFFVAPNGLPGNEDLGATSSWLVFAMLGLYPAVPGVPGFIVSSPVFSQIDLKLADKAFRISAPDVSAQRRYIQDAKLDGSALDGPWLRFDQLHDGGTLSLGTADTPDPTWGAAPQHRPQAVMK